jgi:uncharacterized protein (DUF305 family)
MIEDPQAGPTAPAVPDDPQPEDRSRFFPRTRAGWIASIAALMYFAGAMGYILGIRTDSPPGRDSVDVGFLQDMISHHEQAIEMSNIELAEGSVPDVEAFAREILTFQAYEIGVMETKLAEWDLAPADRPEVAMAWMDSPVPVDQMPGLASPDEMDRLNLAEGNAVDALFVRLMQDHHRGGVHMADHAAEATSDPAVRELAARMARNQRIEIAELEAARERAMLAPTPEGYIPAVIPSGHDNHGG